MVTIHPSILERDGKKAFVVLPYEEFVIIEEELGKIMRTPRNLGSKARESGAPSSLACAEFVQELSLNFVFQD